MASQSIDKYTIDLGLDSSSFQQGIKQATDSFASLSSNIKNIAAGFAGGKFLQSITTGFMNTYTNLSNITSLAGYNITEVDALGKVLEHVGGNVNGVVSTLNNLTTALESARWGSGSLIEASKKYGITFQHSNGQLMTSEELLKSLHVQMQKYDKATRFAIASQLGLDEALQRAFLQTPEALQRQIDAKKRLNEVTEEDTALASQLEDPWLDLKVAWGGLSKELSYVVIPAFAKVINYLKDFLVYIKENNFLIPSFFMGVSLVFLKTLGIIKSVFSFNKRILNTNKDINTSLTQGVGILGRFIPVIKGIGTVFAALGLKTLFSPLTLSIAGIGIALFGIYLLIDDIVAYAKGWDSATGRLLDKFPGLKSFFKACSYMCKDIYDFMVSWLEPLGTFLDWITQALSKLNLFSKIYNAFKKKEYNYIPDEEFEAAGIDPDAPDAEAQLQAARSMASGSSSFHNAYNGSPAVNNSNVSVVNNVNIHANTSDPNTLGDIAAAKVRNATTVAVEIKKYRE